MGLIVEEKVDDDADSAHSLPSSVALEFLLNPDGSPNLTGVSCNVEGLNEAEIAILLSPYAGSVNFRGSLYFRVSPNSTGVNKKGEPVGYLNYEHKYGGKPLQFE